MIQNLTLRVLQDTPGTMAVSRHGLQLGLAAGPFKDLHALRPEAWWISATLRSL